MTHGRNSFHVFRSRFLYTGAHRDVVGAIDKIRSLLASLPPLPHPLFTHPQSQSPAALRHESLGDLLFTLANSAFHPSRGR